MVVRAPTALFLFVLTTLSYVAAKPSFSLTKLIAEGTPGRTYITTELKEIDNDQFVSVNLTLLKRINLQIMVKFKLSKIVGKTTKLIFQAPKFNYCDFRRLGGNIPVITALINAIEGYGNLIFSCPAEPGFYAIEKLCMSKIPLFLIMSKGSYLMISELIDENLKSKPELIMRFKAYLSKN